MICEALDTFAPDLPRVAIVGSRGYKRLHRVRAFVLGVSAPFVLVSGGTAGVGRAAEGAARERGLTVLSLSPDRTTEEGGAELARNRWVFAEAGQVVVFWDEVSAHTLDAIQLAIRTGKLWRVYGATGEWMRPEVLPEAIHYARQQHRRRVRRGR